MKRQRTLKAFFSLVVIFTCAIISYYAFSTIRTTRQTDTVYAFAQQLEYIPVAQIAKYRTCWDIFPSHCGLILYYTTEISLDEFQTKVNDLTPTQVLPRNSDGYTLFDINFVTEKRLTVDGMGDSSNHSRMPEPIAYRWRITEEGGTRWFITFYQVADDGHIYEIDGQQIVGNIVTILLPYTKSIGSPNQ